VPVVCLIMNITTVSSPINSFTLDPYSNYPLSWLFITVDSHSLDG
jgi:hypothetical protein